MLPHVEILLKPQSLPMRYHQDIHSMPSCHTIPCCTISPYYATATDAEFWILSFVFTASKRTRTSTALKIIVVVIRQWLSRRLCKLRLILLNNSLINFEIRRLKSGRFNEYKLIIPTQIPGKSCNYSCRKWFNTANCSCDGMSLS